MKYFWLLLSFVFLVGCMTLRTYEVEKPRIDTDIQGNQGYLLGAPPEEIKENKFGSTRKISVVEIEFGPRETKTIPQQQEARVEEAPLLEEEMPTEIETEQVAIQKITPQKRYTYYTVQKNDTLQKISYKFYKTTRKWQLLYETNKDVIKDPDKLYPGTKIKIPVLD